MVEFTVIKKELEKGKAARRPDWVYPKCALLFLEEWHGQMRLYMEGKSDSNPAGIESYSLTWEDITSTKWLVVDRK